MIRPNKTKKKKVQLRIFFDDESTKTHKTYIFLFTLSFSPLSLIKTKKYKTNEKKKIISPDLCPSDFIQEKNNQTTNITQLPVSYLPSFLRKKKIFGNNDVIITSNKKKEKKISENLSLSFTSSVLPLQQTFLYFLQK